MTPEEAKKKIVDLIAKIKVDDMFWREQTKEIPSNDKSIPVHLWGIKHNSYSSKIGKTLIVISTETRKPTTLQIAHIEIGSGFEASFPVDDKEMVDLVDSIKSRIEAQPYSVLELFEKELECHVEN